MEQRIKLSDRQQEVYDFTIMYYIAYKKPPTFKNISEHFKISKKGVYDHLDALMKKGWLEETPEKEQFKALPKDIKIIRIEFDGDIIQKRYYNA